MSSFDVNQYVVFKYQHEWQEGRISNIVYNKENDSKVYYRIVSFKTMSEIPTLLCEHILQSTPENIRKVRDNIKVLNVDKILNQDKEIYNVLLFDKHQTENNRSCKLFPKYNINIILTDLGRFLLKNKIYLNKEEINLSIEGIKYIFQSILWYVLMTEIEIKNYREGNETVFEKYGVVYLLRTMQVVLRFHVNKLSDLDVKYSVYEFIVYLLDFCNMNSNIYFIKNEYF